MSVPQNSSAGLQRSLRLLLDATKPGEVGVALRGIRSFATTEGGRREALRVLEVREDQCRAQPEDIQDQWRRLIEHLRGGAGDLVVEELPKVVDTGPAAPAEKPRRKRGHVPREEKPDEGESPEAGQQPGFVAREERRPPIRQEEVAQGRRAVEDQQAAVVRQFQKWLDSLAGRRGGSAEENKHIAGEVYDAARKAGIQLIYNDQPAYLYWANRVFQMTTTDSGRRPLGSTANFPQLTARTRQAVKGSKPPLPDPEGGWAETIQGKTKGRQRD